MVRDEERMSVVSDEDRKSFNLECGDVIRVPVGTPIYMINRDENEKLYVVKILQTISILGHFKVISMSPYSFLLQRWHNEIRVKE